MTMKKRVTMLVLVDSGIVLFSIFFGYYLLYPIVNPLTNSYLVASSVSLFVAHHMLASYYGLYRKVWEYASINELAGIFKAVSLSILFVALIQFVLSGDVLLRALLITWMLHMLFIGGSRLSWRLLRDTFIKTNTNLKKKTLIVGAGKAGSMVARQLLINQDHTELNPILFVDDNPQIQGLEIYGLRVKGKVKNIPELVKSYKIEHIILAIPSLSKQASTKLAKISVETGVRTQLIPRIEDLMTGKITVNDIRDVKIEDLLGREEVKLDMKAISENITDKVILVTGAGGSIGSEICRQVMRFSPKKLILVGHGENSIYLIDMELRQKNLKETEIVPIIADVQDRARIFDLMDEFRPDVIYHAAAHKHVPLMEYNPMEAVKNNIFGTKNVAEAADTYGVSNFVLVSTDKAVNPPNVMGATKRFAEMIVQNLAKDSKTKFAAVRFGNVLGSRGSVVPLFKKQIAKGGPVTITDARMTRYFMTIPEASRLVIQAGTLANGGEVFVLDMGEPVKIVDLAKNLIRLSGYSEGDIEVRETGIRPGEKLFEELMNDSERQSEFVFPKIYIGKATPITKHELLFLLEKIPTLTGMELKETLVGVANRRNVEVKTPQMLNVVG
ncbi:polysaccharide biosynthesis protein [Paenisporosarcina quisquiliarum]|uniref:Polysaccharide biosynthesis protein n=1 Tax=Paenisporosarcina quisquiliarum TaxID=365346 RepID=A0A9X3LFY7_9BACL|nr:nucleoside-diphosphate sugar epimerase/dehydratase [Paenisporosarcina quisquiliarum]MCZ8537247.1 polysaccharide biosynthesis protein [Paenisporosarcina quisquiliarum]